MILRYYHGTAVTVKEPDLVELDLDIGLNGVHVSTHFLFFTRDDKSKFDLIRHALIVLLGGRGSGDSGHKKIAVAMNGLKYDSRVQDNVMIGTLYLMEPIKGYSPIGMELIPDGVPALHVGAYLQWMLDNDAGIREITKMLNGR